MIGQWTNHIWQSTVFAASAALLTLGFRRNRAQVRYWLWLSASVKFLLPFWLLMSLGSHLEWAPAGHKTASQALSLTMVKISQPFPVGPPESSHEEATRDWATPAAFGIWACGFAVVGLARFQGWLHIRAAVRSSTRLELPAAVEVRVSPGLLEPGVVGFFHPILLLPAGIKGRLTPRQLDAVLAHELCHVRRRDNVTSAIHMLVEALFWFHPAVWWIGARLVAERERACDEEVLRLGSEPKDYAEGILNICKSYLESPLRCVSGVTGSDLKQRICAILTGRIALELNFARKAVLAVAAVAALSMPILIGMMNALSAPAQSPATGVPKFDVVSIRPCKVGESVGGDGGGKGGGAGPNSPGRLTTPCSTVEELIRNAYVSYATGVLLRRPLTPPIAGGPAWIHADRYVIRATAEGSPSRGTMMGPMMQTLLRDRFRLKLHREAREVAAYALTVPKGGARLRPFHEGSCTPVDWAKFTPPRPENGCNAAIGRKGASVSLEAAGTTVDFFSELLFLALEHPVINRTGIPGLFDFHLVFAIDETTANFQNDSSIPPDLPPAAPAAPSIFAAVQQLGLKLEAARGPRDFWVIDHVEKPSGN